jgi:hypothetical protein
MRLPFSYYFSAVFGFAVAVFLAFTGLPMAMAAEAPQLVQKDGRYALLVDGRPYLILGGQIHNSSGWPSELPQVWESMAALHANTLEAPVYWEQLEPQEGHFDFANVDQIVEGARTHHLHLILLWFGTWKNGKMHYVPAWVKNDPERFPHTIRPDGEPVDVLSPHSRNTLEADKSAFVALMRHLKQIDGEQHTILMVQVENESGNFGTVRDNSPDSNRTFAGTVPADLLAATHKQAGTWSQVFGTEADETFQVYYQAKYINEIAAAGKAEFRIPIYINVWIENTAMPQPQQTTAMAPPQQKSDMPPPQQKPNMPQLSYPSGGAVQKFVGLWRVLAPSIDMIGPDIYSDDVQFYREVMRTYHRPDNPLWIPETGRDDKFARFFFYALGEGAIGFSPFGVDQAGANIFGNQTWKAHANNFALIEPMSREIAELEFEGKLKTSVEESVQSAQELDFGRWQATVSYGSSQPGGPPVSAPKDSHGAAIVAQLGPDEFLVTGVDVSVSFHLPGKLPWVHSLILSAEQGTYENGVWKAVKLWNGDETDRGLSFSEKPEVIRVRMSQF